MRIERTIALLAAACVLTICGMLDSADASTDDATRTLVWAIPGTDGMAQAPGNWLEYASPDDYRTGKAGRPATRLPDKKTNVVLPAAPAGESYIVGYFSHPGRHQISIDKPQLTCRHITIGAGAGLDGGCGTSRGRNVFTGHPDMDSPVAVYGNVTVKAGGYLYGPLHFLGGKDATVRVEKSPEPLANCITVRKTGGASVTVEAKQFDLVKAVTVESGRLVLAADTRLRFGATREARRELGKLAARPSGEIAKTDRSESYVFVRKGAALEMGPGSYVGRVIAPEGLVADLRIEGLLQIGRPGLNNAKAATIALGVAEGDGGFLRQHGGLYLRATGQVKNHGKLVITAYNPSAADTDADADGGATAAPGVSVFLESAVALGEVTFDYLRAGGIRVVNVDAARKALSAARFSKNCAATGNALIAELGLVDFIGGAGTVEFVDGLKTECNVLFLHAGRLVVRSKGNRIAQTFDLASIHTVTVADKRTAFNPKRPLTAAEKELRQRNALWADAPGAGQVGNYAKQNWAPVPLLIWARPGVSGSRFVGPNWLDETGTPRFDSPLDVDPDIDILMPASESFYTASGYGPGGMSRPVPVRHATIEANAVYGSSFNIRGNLWMKHASGLKGRQLGQFVNETPKLNRFVRFDGMRRLTPSRDRDDLQTSADYTTSQWFHFHTGKGGTLEMIGQIRGAADHGRIDGEGTLIMSEGSFLTEGNRSAFAIMPGATVALLQDARIGHEITIQEPECHASVWIAGTLMVGMPERPITRDMPFPVAGIAKDKIRRDPAEGGRTEGVSFLLGKQGRFVVHSADPTKARVVFKMHDSEKAKTKAKERGPSWGTPAGILLYFAGQADLNGVVFDNVLPGGIMAPATTRKSWKNVFYGKHNLAEPEKLHWDMKAGGQQ